MCFRSLEFFKILIFVLPVMFFYYTSAQGEYAEKILSRGVFPGSSETVQPQDTKAKDIKLVLMGTFVSGNFSEAEVYDIREGKLYRVHPGDKIRGLKVVSITGKGMVLSGQGRSLTLSVFSEEAGKVRGKMARFGGSVPVATIPEKAKAATSSGKAASKQRISNPRKEAVSKKAASSNVKKSGTAKLKKAPPEGFINFLRNLIKSRSGKRTSPSPPPFFKLLQNKRK